MLTLADFLVLVFLIGGGWYWFDAMRAKELARHAGRSRCNDIGVTFLDDTVALSRLRLRRDEEGRVTIYREFRFEFSSDGSVRYGGEITFMGGRVTRIEMEPYREAVAHRRELGDTPGVVKNKWLQ